MKVPIACCFLLLPVLIFAQPVGEKLSRALVRLEADSQFRHAIIGFSVWDAATGLPVYRHAGETGLAPASTQKILTSIAAFDILGADYRYTTEIGYRAGPQPGNGSFIIHPSFDPSFGSARFTATQPGRILGAIATALRRIPGLSINPQCRLAAGSDSSLSVPDGWVWEDIGNYYGAGAQAFNWQENQYDVVLASGPVVGSPVRLVATRPAFLQEQLSCSVTAAEKGSGDNSIVYLPYGAGGYTIKGTIPVNEPAFTVGAAVTDPVAVFSRELSAYLEAGGLLPANPAPAAARPDTGKAGYTVLYRHDSPRLDSLTYWFLQKSINLYGEALLKTMALKKTGSASTTDGVTLLKNFWVSHGIEAAALHIMDGSGLSPQNRVTPDALVQALLYASKQPWFNAFYAALPLYNNMKMKSGSIGGARSFTGYQRSATGKNYCFAVIVNNFDGPAAIVRNKIFSLLDLLK